MRALVALLLLANLGWLALAQGWLQPYAGLSSPHEREPQRLAAQIAADSVRVLAVGAATSASAASCLQAGPFSAEQIEAAEAALAPALRAAATWQRQPVDAAGEAQFRLRVEQPDAALRQQLQERVASVPGSRLSACTPPR
jgi:hypothetical protein